MLYYVENNMPPTLNPTVNLTDGVKKNKSEIKMYAILAYFYKYFDFFCHDLCFTGDADHALRTTSAVMYQVSQKMFWGII